MAECRLAGARDTAGHEGTRGEARQKLLLLPWYTVVKTSETIKRLRQRLLIGRTAAVQRVLAGSLIDRDAVDRNSPVAASEIGTARKSVGEIPTCLVRLVADAAAAASQPGHGRHRKNRYRNSFKAHELLSENEITEARATRHKGGSGICIRCYTAALLLVRRVPPGPKLDTVLRHASHPDPGETSILTLCRVRCP